LFSNRRVIIIGGIVSWRRLKRLGGGLHDLISRGFSRLQIVVGKRLPRLFGGRFGGGCGDLFRARVLARGPWTLAQQGAEARRIATASPSPYGG
jgi:hypothetical protein